MFNPPPDPAGLDIAVDLETTGLNWLKDDAFAMAICYPDLRTVCLNLRDPGQFQWAKDHIQRAKSIINHNLKFDEHFMLKMGIPTPPAKHDTMVYGALIFEHHDDYSLDYLGKRYLNEGKTGGIYQQLADLFGGKPDKKTQMPRLHQAPWDLVAPYAVQDAALAYKLWEWQMGELQRQELERVRALEMDLLPVLLQMEHGGVRVDVEGAERAIPEITEHVVAQQKLLDDMLGWPLNVNSPKQMARVFNPKRRADGWWELDDGTLTPATDSGKAAKIDANALRLSKHPEAALILDIKVFMKIRDTFLKGHVLGAQVNGRVHTTYNQTRTDTDGDMYGTGSGRLSSSQPNLQQTSARNKTACRIVRALFLPDEGTEWLTGDFSQIDFRFMAHYLQDPILLEAYFGEEKLSQCSDGKMRAIRGPRTDFHQAVAEMTGLPRDNTPESRASAKAINLGLSFGMGQGRMAEEMGLPFVIEPQPDGRVFKKAGPEASAIFDRYHAILPGLKPMLKQMAQVAKDRGYIRTILGRRCRFPGGDKAYKAGALIFQGGAAELMKMKLVELARIANPSRLMLTVHDSVELSGDPSEIPRLRAQYQSNLLGLKVPIESDWGHGDSWYSAK